MFFWLHSLNLILEKCLKEARNSFKKWPLNLWWISNKAIMEVGNITEVAIFKSFLHLSYKNTQLFFFVTVLFNIFHEENVNWLFLGVTEKYGLRVSFKVDFFTKIKVAKCFENLVVKISSRKN